MSELDKKGGDTEKVYGKVKGPYDQSSIKRRIEALFLGNLGKVLTSEQIREVAKNPKTGKEPENWHQRLSELRTDDGYTILSWRNRGDLKVEEYLMPDATKRPKAAKRVRPTDGAWLAVLKRADHRCEWQEEGKACGLKAGEIDPVGGGTVKLTPDHKTPHATDAHADASDPEQWQALCGRHQVIKKNYWDDRTGWLNVGAIIQAASRQEKWQVFIFLLEHFGYTMSEDGVIERSRAKS